MFIPKDLSASLRLFMTYDLRPFLSRPITYPDAFRSARPNAAPFLSNKKEELPEVLAAHRNAIQHLDVAIKSLHGYLTARLAQHAEPPTSDELATLQNAITTMRQGVAESMAESEAVFNSLEVADQSALHDVRHSLHGKIQEFEELIDRSGL